MSACIKTCVTEEEIRLATVIWNYMKLTNECHKSDVILCLGSYDIRVAEKAAALWLQGMGDWLMFSGNTGKLTESVWTKPEAIVFSERALEMGVPEDKILIEPESTNTGENVRFSYKMLCENRIYPSSIIIVQKTYMERRAYATFMKQWPDVTSQINVWVTSPEVDLLDYPSDATGSLSEVIGVVVGDFARIKVYEEKGFQIHQDIPGSVQCAYEKLIQSDRFNTHMPN